MTSKQSDDMERESPARSAKKSSAKTERAAEAGEFVVTDVRELDSGKYSATLNGVIVFTDLEIKDADGSKKLFFPKSPGRGDRSFRIVNFDDFGAARAIKDAVLTGKTTRLKNPVSIPITDVKVKKHESGALRAFVDVTFADAFTVYGMKVMDGKNGLWVAWPALKEGGEWRDMVFPVTKEFREEVIARVVEEYNKAQ